MRHRLAFRIVLIFFPSSHFLYSQPSYPAELSRDVLILKNMFNAFAGFFRGDPNKVDENGFTRLQAAIMNNNLARVISLIKNGADVNYRGSMIFPPLHLALDKDRQAIALALVQAGADINLKDAQGRTPLHHAALHSQENFVNTLLKLGADPNIQDDHGRTPLHMLGTARPSLIDAFISYKANPNIKDDQGNTPLHHFYERPQMADRLLRNGADANIPNAKGVTPFQLMLDEAVIEKLPAVLHGMLRHDADVNACNGMGETLLHLSARMGNHDFFTSVLRKCNVEACDKQGNTVLHVLAETRNTLFLTRVLDAAPDLLHVKNHHGRTPLGELAHFANSGYAGGKPDGLESMARMLLIHKADPNAADSNGRTLLHYAAARGRTEFAEYLLSRKADPNALDAQGKAPLHLAIEHKNLEMIDLLLDLGADPDLTDARGWTVLDRLAEKNDRDSPVVQRLIVGGGQYNKQLPLNPELMRPRNDNERQQTQTATLDKLPKPKLLRPPGAKPDGKTGGGFKP
jgi:ankyrin repeat protein